MKIYEWSKQLFYLLCGLVAAGMSTYWLNEYWLDKDISTVNYKQIQEVEIESRPVMSLCFNLADTIKINGSISDGNLYLDFMRGKFSDYTTYVAWLRHQATQSKKNFNPQGVTFNRTMWTNINYSSVTLHLADYIQQYELIWKN